MNGFGFSALLIGMLRRQPIPGLDEDLARRGAGIARFGWAALLQLLLFLGLALLSRLSGAG